MKLPKIAVENYQFIVVLLILALGLGVISFLNMPRSEDPVMESPFYTIVAIYPGTSPQDIEELVVNPIEEALNEVEDLKKVIANIEDGIAILNIEANYRVDVQEKYDELVTLLNTVKPSLPDELHSIELSKFNPLDVVILQYALTSNISSYHTLNKQAEVLKKSLEQIEGVRTVDIQGYPKEVIYITPFIEKMVSMNISLSQFMSILQANHLNIPGGSLSIQNRRFSIQTSGGYQNLEAIKNTPISSFEGKPIYVRDIANVYIDYEDETYKTRFQGTESLFLSITQKKGRNILDITEQVEKVASEFVSHLPPSIGLKEVFKQSMAVESRINNFFTNLLQGILLVGIIILLFLGFRTSLVVMTVIPTSILMAIFALDQSGFGLQQISIAGLIIALGLLVDNGIVVVENINRFIREGLSRKEAVIKGTSEVGWALVSATATTVLAFFPMTQLGGGTGEYLKSLPFIVIYALIASLLLALTVTPLLSSKLLSKRLKSPRSMARVMNGLIEHAYAPILAFSLKRPKLILLGLIGIMGISIWLFPKVGVSFFPTADKPLILVDIDLPEGSSLSRTDEVTRYVENILSEANEVQKYASNVGHGNPQIYYNVVPKSFKANYAQVIVGLKEWNPQTFYPLLEKLRVEFASFPGASITVSELKNGPPYEAPIAIRVIGNSLDTLQVLANQVEKLITNTKGTVNIHNPFSDTRTDLKVQINGDKASMLGLQIADIDVAVRSSISGNEIGKLQTLDGEEYPMIIRLAGQGTQRLKNFDNIQITNFNNSNIPLRHIAKLRFQNSASQIDHFNMERMTTITADLKEGLNSRKLTEGLIEQIDKMYIPTGYKVYVAGEYESQQESFGSMGQLLMIALLGIFAVLILQFRSFKQPLIVISSIPLAFTGSIAMLFITGYSFSFFAFVGFTSLVGIVVNTSIILVDYTNQLRAKGLSIDNAIIQASRTRFTPIMLTSLTTITGLLPLTLTQSNLWSPLGWTIIGGMISSTVLTLILVPILYKWVGK